MQNPFNLEHQYQLYLQRVGLSVEKMHPAQVRETRSAFMGACGQMLILLRDDMYDLPEEKAVDAMQDMLNQVGQFFLDAANRSQ